MLGPIYIKGQCQHCDNFPMMLAILFSLETTVSLENGLQLHSGATPLLTESLASLESCYSADADADTLCQWTSMISNGIMKCKGDEYCNGISLP